MGITVINDPYRNLSSSVGAAFGTGLGEQIPKTVEQQILSHRMQKFANEFNERAHPLQNLARFMSLPVSSQQIQSFGNVMKELPFVGGLGDETEGKAGLTPPKTGEAETLTLTSKQPVKPSEWIGKIQEDVRGKPKTQEQKTKARGNLNLDNPTLSKYIKGRELNLKESLDFTRDFVKHNPNAKKPDVDKALEIMNQQSINAPIRAQEERERIQKIQKNIDDGIDKELMNITHSLDMKQLNDAVPYEARQAWKNEALDELEQNKSLTERDVIQKYANKAHEYYKDNKSINDFQDSNFISKIGQAPNINKTVDHLSALNKQIGQSRNYYEKLRSTFNNQTAAHKAFPMSPEAQKDADRLLKKYPFPGLYWNEFVDDYNKYIDKHVGNTGSVLSLLYPLTNTLNKEYARYLLDEIKGNPGRFNEQQNKEILDGVEFVKWSDVFLK